GSQVGQRPSRSVLSSSGATSTALGSLSPHSAFATANSLSIARTCHWLEAPAGRLSRRTHLAIDRDPTPSGSNGVIRLTRESCGHRRGNARVGSDLGLLVTYWSSA